ncbi:MAG: hypothetical protein ACREEW_02140 [Caulobacteraceae bacterium]
MHREPDEKFVRHAKEDAPRDASEAEAIARDSPESVIANLEKARLAAEASRGEDA